MKKVIEGWVVWLKFNKGPCIDNREQLDIRITTEPLTEKEANSLLDPITSTEKLKITFETQEGR